MGIIPRVMNRIFEMIEQSSETLEFSIKVSMLEIYNERIQDLLNPLNNNLKIKESKLAGVFVDECTEVYVSSATEMREAMLLGSQNRTIASTRMNERSSRSHSIFVMTIAQKDLGTGTSKLSRIYFVDLAGSEKVAKTDVKGKQLEEAKNINKSLTALGMVINTLAEGKKGSHIPYRDSKLTRLLQDSLGGNSMTTLLIACSMCSYNDKETLSTLRFGQRAKSIKNKPKENVELSARELQHLLEQSELKLKDTEALLNYYQSECTRRGLKIDISAIKNSSQIFEFKQGGNKSELLSIEDASKDQNLQEFDLLGLSVPDVPPQAKTLQTSSSEIVNLTLAAEKQDALEAELKKEVSELRSKVAKQTKEIADLNDMIELIQAEMEDLTLENVDWRQKNDSLVKGGIGLISRYHKELGHANMAFDHASIKIQKKLAQHNHIISEFEKLRDVINGISEKFESNPKLNQLALGPEVFKGIAVQSLKTLDLKKEIPLAELLWSISQELLSPFENSPMKLGMSEFTLNIDKELMNLASAITKFKNSALDEGKEVDIIGKSSHDKEIAQTELTYNVPEKELSRTLIDSMDIPTQMKELLEESQLANEQLRNKLKELKESSCELRAQLRSEYDQQIIENIQKFNEELNFKGQQLDELQESCFELQVEVLRLTRENQDLVTELENLRRGFSKEIATPRGDRNRTKPSELELGCLQSEDQDSSGLMKKVVRYRKERDRAEQQARELRARLIISEENLQLESEKNLVLKRTIRELEHELDQLSKSARIQPNSLEHHLSQQVKTLRGGNKGQKELLPHHMNIFTCEDLGSESEEEHEMEIENEGMQDPALGFNESPRK